MSIILKKIPKTAKMSGSLCGIADIPGDKSISHRAIILGALAVGETTVTGLLESSDVLSTIEAMRAFGVEVTKKNEKKWSIFGVGVGGFSEPNRVIDCGNSGTGIRLIMGAMATSPIIATFTGDESLVTRPMARVLEPLEQFGASFISRFNGLLPLTIRGSSDPISITYSSLIPSAQIKSAVLLAALNSPGTSVFNEPQISRDHTENMLSAFGANITVSSTDEGNSVSIEGYPELTPQTIFIPGDPSSAAFPICATLIVKGSSITLKNICYNPTRIGLLITLREMGAAIEIENIRDLNGEPVADIFVSASSLCGVEVPIDRVVSMIDEFPILAVVASVAKGKTVMKGLQELRVKESDRISAIFEGLKDNGVEVQKGSDSLTIVGKGLDSVPGGATVKTFSDHRIAMSFLCLGLVSKQPITVDDSQSISTSFPGFFSLMKELGAEIT
jgi:3-phosphoshikimate 1-carboxyvinyltransferase